MSKLLTALDKWYVRHARDLPWRAPPGAQQRTDPYLVWLSEVMLQQTTVPHAAPYFLHFVDRWPTVEHLAKASWEDVSGAWAGLGYYSRARKLHACAQVVAERGSFPQEAQDLQRLPGIGPYTSAAIAAIAFGERIAPVDGNIERVLSRLETIGSDGSEAGWRAAKQVIAARAQHLFDALPSLGNPGDLAQALMDLGATICTPKSPNCSACPVSDFCRGMKEGAPDRYPVKPQKKPKPVRRGAAFIAIRDDDVLLERRPDTGLLGGMLMPPCSDWVEGERSDPMQSAPMSSTWERVGEVRHVFTHFVLELEVWRTCITGADPAGAEGAEWVEKGVALTTLPTVGRKAVAMAIGTQRPSRRRRQIQL